MAKKEYASYLVSLADILAAEQFPGFEEARRTFFSTGDFNGLNWLGHLIDMEGTLYLYNRDEKHLHSCNKALFLLFEVQDDLICEKPVFAESGNTFIEAVKGSGFTKDYTVMPVIEIAFSFGPALKTLCRLFKAGVYNAAERARIEKLCICEITSLFNEAEWGTHNRCVLRGVMLNCFSEMFPENAMSEMAANLSKRLFEQNVGRWSIEDANGYSAIWINALSEYIVAKGIWHVSVDAVMGYYANYFASLILPWGGFPEYGDSRFDMGTDSLLALSAIELVAARHKDGFLKYAAEKIFKNVSENKTLDTGFQATRGLTNALLWSDDGISPTEPEFLSCEALCDMIGKKIVYRSGWDKSAHYLMFNYRDIGPYGRLGRKYLQKTIPVHAEKPHHGHADEQSIAALCANGAVFLRDGGYRDAFTTNGHYRADFYHNRVIMRSGRMFKEKGLIEYAENIGDYLPVTTEKLYFERFSFAEVSRTRLNNPCVGMDCDRSIIYLKDERVYIIIDSLRALTEGPRTTGVLYFAETLQSVAEGVYRIEEDSPEGLYMFRKDKDELCAGSRAGTGAKQSLLVAFAGRDRAYSVEEIRRNYRTEQGLSQYVSRYFKENEFYNFVSVLIPETGNSEEETTAARARAGNIAASLSLVPVEGGKCVSVSLAVDGSTYTIGLKNDDSFGIADLNARPVYTYEAGKAGYGEFETDALLLVGRENGSDVRYALVEVTQANFRKRNLFAAKPYQNLQMDYSRKMGVCSWGSIEGKA